MASVGEVSKTVVIISAGFSTNYTTVGTPVLLSVSAVEVESVSQYETIGCGEFGAGEV